MEENVLILRKYMLKYLEVIGLHVCNYSQVLEAEKE